MYLPPTMHTGRYTLNTSKLMLKIILNNHPDYKYFADSVVGQDLPDSRQRTMPWLIQSQLLATT